MTWLQNLTLTALTVASALDALNNAHAQAVTDARLAALEVSCVVDR